MTNMMDDFMAECELVGAKKTDNQNGEKDDKRWTLL